MQPTISIPKHWEYPRFAFGQRTQQGIVIGLEYKPAGTQLAHEYGNSWRYTVLPDKHSDEVRHYSDDQIQTLYSYLPRLTIQGYRMKVIVTVVEKITSEAHIELPDELTKEVIK